MKNFFTIGLVLCLAISAMAQPFYVRGLAAPSPCDWANTNIACQLIEFPAGTGVYTLTAALSGANEFKIFNAGTNSWYPGGENAWVYGTGSVVGFGINPAMGNIVSAPDATSALCAPGALNGWDNNSPMTNIGSDTWCFTVATPGTYEWKPTRCGSWNSWNSSDGARSVNPGNWSITTSVANSQVCVTYSPLTGLVSMAIVLPLRLVSFKGYSENKKTILAWRTENEENASHFEIEKSMDGTTWSTVGTIKARDISETENIYSFVDKETSNEPMYYRLKMIDNDRSFTYSKIISVTQMPTNSVKVFPNPAAEQVTFIFNNEVEEPTVEIFDMKGQLMKQQILTDSELNISELPSGIYVASLKNQAGQVIAREKIVKK
jgi:Secretion system C-terminal sorting domain